MCSSAGPAGRPISSCHVHVHRALGAGPRTGRARGPSKWGEDQPRTLSDPAQDAVLGYVSPTVDGGARRIAQRCRGVGRGRCRLCCQWLAPRNVSRKPCPPRSTVHGPRSTGIEIRAGMRWKNTREGETLGRFCGPGRSTQRGKKKTLNLNLAPWAAVWLQGGARCRPSCDPWTPRGERNGLWVSVHGDGEAVR